MSYLTVCWSLIKMIYKLLWYSISLLSLLFNIFWFICNLASAGIPWFTLAFVIVCVASKFVKLHSPDEKRVLNLIGSHTGGPIEDLSYWPIANRGGGYDAPENSKMALKKCIARGYRNVLLDAGLTASGDIAIVSSLTLERTGLCGIIQKYTMDELKKINITELHPLGSQFEPDYIMSLTDLLNFLEENHLTVFLYIHDNSTQMLDSLKTLLKQNTQFMRRIILLSRSPIAIYQLRKLYPDLICGLWMEKSLTWKASTLITSIYGAIFRNIIAPVIGISVVYVSKDEFNLHVGELWRNVGVRPIVYNVNSPSEKRYFQKTMKTQYLTDSLRSEPHLLMKA